jgi:hypothetical protein
MFAHGKDLGLRIEFEGIPDVNHFFTKAIPSLPGFEYEVPSEFDPRFIHIVTHWLEKIPLQSAT